LPTHAFSLGKRKRGEGEDRERGRKEATEGGGERLGEIEGKEKRKERRVLSLSL
jgi:hypothetical protein